MEIITLSHLLRTSIIYAFVRDSHNWVRITPEAMDQDFIIPITQKVYVVMTVK